MHHRVSLDIQARIAPQLIHEGRRQYPWSAMARAASADVYGYWSGLIEPDTADVAALGLRLGAENSKRRWRSDITVPVREG